MGVFETEAGTWGIDYRYKGKRYKTVVALTQKLAKDIERKVLTDIKEGKFFPDLDKQDVTFTFIADKYWTLHGSKTRGAWNFIYTYNKIIARFGHVKVANITTEDVQKFYNDTWERTSASTANRHFTLFRSIINKAINLKLYKGFNPCIGVVRQRENPPRERYFTRDDIRNLLLNAEERLKPLIAFAVLTGCRRSEALNLTWKDVDFHSGIIRIAKTKAGKPREIPMSDDLRPILWTMRGNPFDKVFNITAPALRYSFNKLLKKVGLTDGYCFHTCRHTFASLYMQNNGNITDLQRILGHAKIELTMRYSHFSPQYIKQTIKVMDGIVALPQIQHPQLEQK